MIEIRQGSRNLLCRVRHRWELHGMVTYPPVMRCKRCGARGLAIIRFPRVF